jgi:hypothetical protein
LAVLVGSWMLALARLSARLSTAEDIVAEDK